MGMDVCGVEPKNKVGECFRNNVWWWHRLWDFTCDVAGIDEELRESGHFNQGAGMDEQGALEAAKALRRALADGRVDEYERQLREAATNAPNETCFICKGSGTRVEEGLPVPCVACGGTGKSRPIWTAYGFARDNVEGFADFLEACGGFNIW